MFWVDAKFGPTGKRQVGYVVIDTETSAVIATFTNRQFGYWLWARRAAQAECARLNAQGAA